MHPPEGDGELAHGIEVAAVVGGQGMEVRGAHGVLVLEAVPRTAHRRSEGGIGVVAHQRDRRVHHVERQLRGLQLADAAIHQPPERVEEEVLLFQVEGIAGNAEAAFDPLRGGEGVRQHSDRGVDEDPLPQGPIGGHAVRRTFEARPKQLNGYSSPGDAPVPAPFHVLVEELSAHILEGALGLDGDPQTAVPEHVAEERRGSALQVVAVDVAGSDADHGLTHVVELQAGVVGGCLFGAVCPRGRQSGERIGQVVRDPAAHERLRRRNQTALRDLRPLARQFLGGARFLRGERVDVKLEFIEDREHQGAGFGGDAHGRRTARDPADRGRDVGYPIDLAGGKIHAVDVAEAVLVGDEVEAPAVRSELGVEVLDVLEQVERTDLAGLHVEKRDARAAEDQIGEVRFGSPVGDEGEHGAVG